MEKSHSINLLSRLYYFLHGFEKHLMLQYLLSAPRPIKRLITVVYDATTIPLAVYAALALRHGEVTLHANQEVISTIVATTALTLLVFTRLGLYRAVVRYMASKAYGTLAMGITLSALILATSSFVLQSNLPRSSIIIYWFTAFTLLGLPRLFIRSIVAQLNNSLTKEAVVIYGAGNQGIALLNALSNNDKYRPIAFIDDNYKKQKTIIQGLKVLPATEFLTLSQENNISKILLAHGQHQHFKKKTTY